MRLSQTLAAAVTLRLHDSQFRDAVDTFEALLASPGYLNNRRAVAWVKEHAVLQKAVASLPAPLSDYISTGSVCRFGGRLQDIFLNHDDIIAKRNDAYVKDCATKYAEFFAGLEAYPLTSSQVEAVLRDEDYALVVAGAGTGKTSAVVGKAGFLVRSGIVEPEEVLALAFARKAAGEMQERIKDKTGEEIEIRTFHSLGWQIILEVENEKPMVTSMALHEKAFHAWISECLTQLLGNPSHRDAYVNYVVYHRYPAKYLDNFEKRGSYLQYLRKHEPLTLRGEWVRSFEELLIADWLTINGFAYVHENPYKYKTATRLKRQYKPDFYLPDYDIYLEHFGIDRDGRTALGIDSVKYAEGIKWKRELHASCGTKLIETYSYERKEGILLAELERKLRQAGAIPRPLSDDELQEVVEHPGVKPQLVALLGDFHNVFKANLWTLDEARARAEATADPLRARSFLALFEIVFNLYEQKLADRQEIDFADMIARATKYVVSGEFRSPFRRIIVDEFQDISQGRLRLLQALLEQVADSRLFCVGDDWQSIFRFTGSDIGIMTKFPEVMGYMARIDLDRTFRFSDALLRVSSRFIQKNPEQLRKELRSEVRAEGPAVYVVKNPEKDWANVLEMIDQDRPARKNADVLLLGRYNHTAPKDWESVARRYPKLRIDFLTVHKAKGLQADYVVILCMKSGRYGFPSEIANDPLMELVLPCDAVFEHAEERRLFYVALTRARRRVYLMCDIEQPSAFVREISQDPYRPDVEVEGEVVALEMSCPECQTGQLVLAKPDRRSGYAWRCTSWPYCDGRAKNCPSCWISPVVGSGCNNPGCVRHFPE